MTSNERSEHDLRADLETVREIVSRASEDPGAVTRLEEELLASRRVVEELRAQLAEAVRPVMVSSAEVASLSDREVLAIASAHARSAALVLGGARYEGDAGELWDVARIFGSVQAGPVIARAARAFLGQQGVL